MPPARPNRFLAASRGVAGFLAAALLFCELLASYGPWHQSLHHTGKASSTSCLLCLFAKGQVDLSETAPAGSLVTQSSFSSALLIQTIALVDFSYLAFPSRAPPVFVSLSSVVA